MTFADIGSGASVFLDANVFVYHFQPHATYGPACTSLLKRIENREIAAFTSTHVLGEVLHRLMTFEACARFGWSMAKIARRLKQHPTELQQLSQYQQALNTIHQLGVQVLSMPSPLIDTAVLLCQQFGLLTNDALIVAVMQHYGLTAITSLDADFDRVPGVMRYAPA